MKKLLSILATVGLASTAGATVVACGQTGTKSTTRDATTPATVGHRLSKKYDDTTSLETVDKINLRNVVLGALKEANKDCNFTDEDFDIQIPEDINKSTTSLKVEVKKTEPTEEKLGLNATSLTVTINLDDPVAQVEAQGVTLEMNFEHTTAGQPLEKEDKVKLENEIIAALKEKNKNAVIADDTFSVVIGFDVTPETKEILAKNKETASSGNMPGLIASDKIKVELVLTPIHGRVPAKGAEVKMPVSSGPGDLISDEEKEQLTGEIKAALELANSNAVVEEDTFDFELPADLKDGSNQKLEVLVHETLGTTEKDGLMNGPVTVTLNLNALKDKVDARGVEVKFELEESHLGEHLTDKDKTNLQAEILEKLKIANNDAVVEEDTFGFEALNSIIVKKEHDFIGVTVKETESTYELHGLNSAPAIVKLTLNPDVKDTVKANLPAEPVQINLDEAHEGENLNEADLQKVRAEVKEALLEANKDAVVDPEETFTVDWPKELNASASSIGVLVQSTESTIENPGLEAEIITVEISLVPMQRVVNPRGAEVEFTLEGSLIGEKLSESDKAGLAAKMLEQLTEANSNANIQEDTFEIDLDEFTVVEEEPLMVHVNATEATNEKQGLFEQWVLVNIHLNLFIDDLAKLIPADTDLGFISDNNPQTILAELEAQIPEATGEVKIESVTETSATVIAANPKKYQGEVSITFTVIQEVAKLLEGKSDLGYVDSVDEAKTKAEEIITSIPALNDGKVNIGEPVDGTILVSANDESLTGEATLTYVLTQDINDLLKDKAILEFYVSGQAANSAVQKLVDDTQELNGKVLVDLDEASNKIIVTPNHDSLKGNPFEFSYKISTNLEELLPEALRDLGEVNDADTALTKASQLIAELELTDKVTVEKVQEQDQIKVTFLEDSGLTGEVILTFTLPA